MIVNFCELKQSSIFFDQAQKCIDPDLQANFSFCKSVGVLGSVQAQQVGPPEFHPKLQFHGSWPLAIQNIHV